MFRNRKGIEMIKPQIDKLTPLVKTRFLSLYDACYKNKEGNEKHWIIATRKSEEALYNYYFENGSEKEDAVVLIAKHQDTDSLILIKQFRVPLNDYIYELPAGLIDPGETVTNTISRELKEETGLDLIDVTKVQPLLYLSAGMTDESVALVYCTCTGSLSTDYLEADEFIEPLLISRAEAKELIENGEKLDIKAYMVLQQFINNML